jgi:hypothetical protein
MARKGTDPLLPASGSAFHNHSVGQFMDNWDQLAVYLGLALVVLWFLAAGTALFRGQVYRCPRCYTRRVRRSLRRVREMFLPGFILAYRCEVCHKRYYTLRSMDYRRRRRFEIIAIDKISNVSSRDS